MNLVLVLHAIIATVALVWICIFGEKHVEFANAVAINMIAKTTILLDLCNSKFSDKNGPVQLVSVDLKCRLFLFLIKKFIFNFSDVNIKTVPEPARLDWVPPNIDTNLVKKNSTNSNLCFYKC